jgi:hypothetical protein
LQFLGQHLQESIIFILVGGRKRERKEEMCGEGILMLSDFLGETGYVFRPGRKWYNAIASLLVPPPMSYGHTCRWQHDNVQILDIKKDCISRKYKQQHRDTVMYIGSTHYHEDSRGQQPSRHQTHGSSMKYRMNKVQ